MSGKHSSTSEPAGSRVTPQVTDTSEPTKDEIAQLHAALASQRDIGMAIGLVSARYGCSTEEAWRTMLRVSQDSNTKVRTVARVLVVVHDGTSSPEDHEILKRFEDELPASGWPEGPST